ncbi:hypothetical protein LCGC14_0845070 [marine sediment metagenome]|uniref:Uncharacterized protein n=1 Tax=marine sediment metagenome TaxID=412755 RepID=A0A0F9RWP6_9ZZZZ
MTDAHTMTMIQNKIEIVEAEGFGEVNIKIKNGAVYLVTKSDSTYIENKLDKTI